MTLIRAVLVKWSGNRRDMGHHLEEEADKWGWFELGELNTRLTFLGG